MGYSQGAQVTADFLCGTSSAGFAPTPAYASSVAGVREFSSPSFRGLCAGRPQLTLRSPPVVQVAAAVIMADPSFVKNLTWDRGTANNVSVSLPLSPAPPFPPINRPPLTE